SSLVAEDLSVDEGEKGVNGGGKGGNNAFVNTENEGIADSEENAGIEVGADVGVGANTPTSDRAGHVFGKIPQSEVAEESEASSESYDSEEEDGDEGESEDEDASENESSTEAAEITKTEATCLAGDEVKISFAGPRCPILAQNSGEGLRVIDDLNEGCVVKNMRIHTGDKGYNEIPAHQVFEAMPLPLQQAEPPTWASVLALPGHA
ncbi:hypothetical protein U1Q18_001054, partial [Sarracenia purpurea var. burkii]